MLVSRPSCSTWQELNRKISVAQDRDRGSCPLKAHSVMQQHNTISWAKLAFNTAHLLVKGTLSKLISGMNTDELPHVDMLSSSGIACHRNISQIKPSVSLPALGLHSLLVFFNVNWCPVGNMELISIQHSPICQHRRYIGFRDWFLSSTSLLISPHD